MRTMQVVLDKSWARKRSPNVSVLSNYKTKEAIKSPHHHRGHGEGAGDGDVVEEADGVVGGALGEDVQQGEVVLGGGDGLAEGGAAGADVEEGAVVAAEDEAVDGGACFGGPVEGEARCGELVPGDQAEVVDDVAAADDEDAAVPQGSEFSGEGEMACGVEGGVEAHLDHRHIRQRKQVAQDRPSAVVESPRVVLGERVGVDATAHLRSQIRAPRRRVLHRIQGVREAAEVVDGARLRHSGYAGAAGFPMR